MAGKEEKMLSETKNVIREIEKKYLRKEIPPMRIGDTVRAYVKIIEGDSERLQPFEGVLIRRRGSGINETITLRKMSYGVGVERIFPLHSPYLEKLEVQRSARVRRAKLYYLRRLSGRAARMTTSEEETAGAGETNSGVANP